MHLAALGRVKDVEYGQLGIVLLGKLGGTAQRQVGGVAQVMGNEDMSEHEVNLRPMDVGDLLSIKK
jgi:hypothetical protein